MTSLPPNFRDILKSELALRFRKNSRYSLRAFARDLQVTPARLSEVLSGKKGLSRESALNIAKRLGLSSTEQEFFADLVESEHARSKLVKKEAKTRVNAQQSKNSDPTQGNGIHLTLDSFRFIEDWYHLAILQLLRLPSAPKDYAVIAKKLDISVHQVENAISRMLRLELLETVDGNLIPVHDWTMSYASVPSRSIRKFHEQLIDHSKIALHERVIGERVFRSNIFSTELNRVPEIEEKIKKFSVDLMKEYSTYTTESEVVALTLQFFPLSQKTGVLP